LLVEVTHEQKLSQLPARPLRMAVVMEVRRMREAERPPPWMACSH
jgi:hypothetical protein